MPIEAKSLEIRLKFIVFDTSKNQTITGTYG